MRPKAILKVLKKSAAARCDCPDCKPSINQRLIDFCKTQDDVGLDDLVRCTRCKRKAVAHNRCIICGHKEGG
jgi:hypothetical protein